VSRAAPPAGVAGAELLLLHGEEGHLVDLDARRWLAAARAASLTDLDVEIIEQATKLEGLRRALTEIPFLADRRYVLLRDPPQLGERARRGADSADELSALIGERAPSSSLCVVAHLRVAAGNPVIAAVRKAGGRVVEHPALKGRELREWVDRRVAESGLRLPRAAVEHLLRVAGPNLGVIDGELSKLAAFAAGGGLVTLDDVRRLVAGAEQLETWDILDRLFLPPHGRGPAAVDALLADGVAVQLIASVVAGQLRELLRVHELRRDPRGQRDIAAQLGLPPWRVERLLRWAAVTTPEMTERWLRSLQHLDAEVKQGRLDDAAGLRSVMLRAARDVAEGSAA
jgi:DNA polymerase III subunit delta